MPGRRSQAGDIPLLCRLVHGSPGGMRYRVRLSHDFSLGVALSGAQLLSAYISWKAERLKGKALGFGARHTLVWNSDTQIYGLGKVT